MTYRKAKRIFCVSLCCFFALQASSSIKAQVPRTISYQGSIVTPTGAPIKDGQHVVIISFYDDPKGGAPLYTEILNTEVKRGLFCANVGSSTPIPPAVKFDHVYYLGIAVDGGEEMSPRTILTSVPYALHSETAEYANRLSTDIKGVITSINEIDGPIRLSGDSSISVTTTGRIIQLHIISAGIRTIGDTDNTMIITNPNGPSTKVGVADNGITTKKIVDRAITPNKINQAGATNGQVLKWNGTTWVPSDDMNFAPIAGNDITITGNSIAVTHPLPIGTVSNSTFRWTGSSWAENTNLLSTAAGLTTINNNLLLTNNGQPSELRFYEASGAGSNYSAFRPQQQLSDITYTLPASLPPSIALLTVDNTGILNWSTSIPMNVPFDRITSGINQGQMLTVGNGSIFAPSGTGIVTANQFVGTGSVTNSVDLATGEVAGILPIQNGGTNSGAQLQNDRLMISKNGAIVEFASGNFGEVLISKGGSAAPAWNTINLLPNGTANNSTLRWNAVTNSWQENINVLTTAGGLLTVNNGINLNTSSSPLQVNGSVGTAGQVLTSAGIGNTPTWSTVATIPTGTAADNTLRWNGASWVETANVKSSTAGLVTVNAGVNHNGLASPLQLNGSAGTTGQFLTSAGTGNTPTWTTGSLLANGTATDNTLRWNGASWVETANVKSSAAGLVTVNAGINHNGAASPLQLNGAAGTSGQVLTSAGAGATPTWTTVNVLTNGTALDNTLRWNGASWVETANVKSSAAGLVTVSAGLTINNLTSPLNVRGSDGTLNYILVSQGAGSTPQWTDPSSLLTGWKLTGNTGTNPGVGGGQNFLGTTDAKDLVLATNGVEHMRISSTTGGIASSPTGVTHFKSVLPGGNSSLITGVTVETLLPSTATDPAVAVSGLYSQSTVDNSFLLGLYCGQDSRVNVTGTSGISEVRAVNGNYVLNNNHPGVTHSIATGVYGSIWTLSGSNTNTITTASAIRAAFAMLSTSSTITNANGLYVENPFLGGVSGTVIGTYNGVYIENLTSGTTKRAILYDGSGTNQPFAVTDAGNVGIGRIDPTQALELRNGNILLSNNNNTAGELRFAEPSSSGTNYTAFKALAQASDITYTLPAALPAANSGVLISSTTGAMSWGSNLAWDNTNARLGTNTSSPNTTVDVNGDIAMREHGYTAANGNNNDANIGNYSFVRISGPGAAFTITGIAGGQNGKMVILYNSTAQNMTISHNDANSNASNRIYCKGSGNLTVGQYGVATLIYNSTDSRWIVVSTN